MNVTELKLRKIGNSRGVILSAEILNKMNAYEDDTVFVITVNDDGSATLENKSKAKPFLKFDKYASAWRKENIENIEKFSKEITTW